MFGGYIFGEMIQYFYLPGSPAALMSWPLKVVLDRFYS